MKANAIDKARSRLAKADGALRRLMVSNSFDEFEAAWTDFLIAANSVYSCLEQGAKDFPKSRQWFDQRSADRRKDPLLQYMHQARNADEHGIEPIAEHRPGHIAIGRGGEDVHIRNMVVDGGNVLIDFIPVDGKIPTVEVAQPHAALKTVRNRGRQFDPPTYHLGVKLADNSPGQIADLALVYHAQLIDQAANLVV